MNNEVKELKGTFKSFIKKDGDKWGLIYFQPENEKSKIVIYAVAPLPMCHVDYEILVQPNNRNYRLLEFKPYKKENTQIDWVEFFKNHIKGVGQKSAEKINEIYGAKIFDLINFYEDNEEELKNNLTTSQIEGFKDFWKIPRNQKTIKELLGKTGEADMSSISFFYNNNLEILYNKLLEIHDNDESIDFVKFYTKNQPYILYTKYNLNLLLVDQFALLLKYSKSFPERVKAYLKFIIQEKERDNSTLLPATEIFVDLQTKTEIESPILKEILIDLCNQGYLFYYNKNGKDYFSLGSTRKKEFFIYEFLEKINNQPPKIFDSLDSSKLNDLSKKQQEAYLSFLKENILIITGGPGTGKTHLINKLNQTLKLNRYKNENDYVILAPTGRAATNISNKIKSKVKTIHSFLRIPTDLEEPEYDEDRELIKVLIIDEFSMVNLNIFEKLLRSCPNLEKLVLIGDIDQLPAIGPGNLLENLLLSNKFSATYLVDYFRSDSKTIWEHFNSIKKEGELPKFHKGIVDLYEFNDLTLTDQLVDLYSKKLQKTDLENLILLCPTYKGNEGLINLNNLIQNKINPQGRVVHTYKKLGQTIEFRVGDKVIQLENRINDEIYNGDFGRIVAVDEGTSSKAKDKKIKIEFNQGHENKTIVYTREEFYNQIALGYGVTVHKFQGSEINNVIFLVHPKHNFMLTKKMLYTGTSRAKKYLAIVTTNKSDYREINLKNEVYKKEILTNLELFLKGEKWN
ncbi:ATP-dependent DNA helicase [Mycoplasmopsis gallopavonis]|uniref:Exodeoxyribonuclease V C-terminal n=1 Tax=Mycoplasmopsis gallopavonis TaxID=76629 RepID=A0A449AZS0_9BACT|nr:AAA family ATPase [Mycoplasmopsis gallopavonis]RIV16298.1 hypothetical protein D1113_02900 [Mycoplasmopsis gallopavonis]VEU72630.1 exodeoxyribonuclease V C-terminal fragment [Mycoplasmopsis gallopavonis]VEU72975.1 exodeoxyribonuclease V C-terminal fragment [Mycoplasmopsis gallopavonis]